jgi:hypothetical protein
MARVRYSVTVHARRYEQPAYKYTEHASVKPGKLERVLFDTATQVLDHETRGDFQGYLATYPFGAVVVVGGCRFVVRAQRV